MGSGGEGEGGTQESERDRESNIESRMKEKKPTGGCLALGIWGEKERDWIGRESAEMCCLLRREGGCGRKGGGVGDIFAVGCGILGFGELEGESKETLLEEGEEADETE